MSNEKQPTEGQPKKPGKMQLIKGIGKALMGGGNLAAIVPLIQPMLVELNPMLVQVFEHKAKQYDTDANLLSYNIQVLPYHDRLIPLVFLQKCEWKDMEGQRVRVLYKPFEQYTVPQFLEILLNPPTDEQN